MDKEARFDTVRAWIQHADGLLITAGAGMGVDSGLPDFRGPEGFWNAYPALRGRGLSFVDMATPSSFRRDATLAWGFYGHRLALYRETQPHAGYALLLRWAERMPHGAFVFTSNVDGHFQKAGFADERVVECHGSLHALQCLDACSAAIWSADSFLPDVDTAYCRLRNAPPRCPHCGALARPNVLMFDDWDWIAGRAKAQHRALAEWLEKVRSPVVIELGAGLAVPTVRRFGERLNAPLIRINPHDFAIGTEHGVGFRQTALQGLQLIDARLKLHE